MAPPPLRTTTALLDAPIAFVRERWRQLLPPVLTWQLLVTLPAGASQVLLHQRGNEMVGGALPEPGLLVSTYGLSVITMLFWMMSMLAAFEAVRRSLGDEPVRLGPVSASIFSPRVLFTTLAWMLLLSFGFACCMVPGLVFLAGFGFVIPVVLHEGLGTGAFGRAWDLGTHHREGRWSRAPAFTILLLALVWLLLSAALNALISVPSAAYAGYRSFRMLSTGEGSFNPYAVVPLWITLLMQVLGAGFRTVADLYLATAVTLLYRDARMRVGGDDFEADLAHRLRGTAVEGDPD